MIDPLPLLADLARHPAAPLRETAVAHQVRAYLTAAGVPWQQDRYGNILARVQRGAPKQAVAMVAHMDHPAFEITAVDGGGVTGLLLGGVRVEALPVGTPLRLHSGGQWSPATLLSAQREAATGAVTLGIDAAGSVAPGDWGVWDMPAFQEDGDLIRMRACDDLAGCACILAALASAAAAGRPVDLTGMFTRAEEIGLVGATLVAKQGLLPAATLVISVESSRQLPGAVQGGGPVIRVGDVRSTFSQEAESLLRSAAEALRVADPAWRSQRQLMNGGTCEATAFALFGYRTTGIALPLGNYHNVPDALYDAGPGATAATQVAPEFIHRADLAGAAQLLTQTALTAADPPPDTAKSRLEQLADQYSNRLTAAAE